MALDTGPVIELTVECRFGNCPTCEGYGVYPANTRWGDPNENSVELCQRCRGTGKSHDRGHYEISDGLGYIMLHETFDITAGGDGDDSDVPF